MTQETQQQNVVILGASHNPERYSNKAIKLLLEKGYTVIPVHPKKKVIEGIPVVNALKDISEPVDTLTMYVGAARSHQMLDELAALNLKRIIFNPGSESDEVEALMQQKGVEVVHGCTLVMLKTDVF